MIVFECESPLKRSVDDASSEFYNRTSPHNCNYYGHVNSSDRWNSLVMSHHRFIKVENTFFLTPQEIFHVFFLSSPSSTTPSRRCLQLFFFPPTTTSCVGAWVVFSPCRRSFLLCIIFRCCAPVVVKSAIGASLGVRRHRFYEKSLVSSSALQQIARCVGALD